MEQVKKFNLCPSMPKEYAMPERICECLDMHKSVIVSVVFKTPWDVRVSLSQKLVFVDAISSDIFILIAWEWRFLEEVSYQNIEATTLLRRAVDAEQASADLLVELDKVPDRLLQLGMSGREAILS
eukprot:360911-Amphidinium_carterae.2